MSFVPGPGVLEVVNRTSGDSRGALGAIVRDRRNPARFYALTAGHVVAAQSRAAGRDLISFGELGGATLFEGALLDWVPASFRDSETAFDAAIALVAHEAVETYAATRPQDLPAGCAFSIRPGEALRLFACDGRVVTGQASGRVSCRMGDAEADVDYTLVEVYSWIAPDGTLPGDSGAPVWNADDQLVGIHAGSAPGDPQRPMLVPIFGILEYFRVDLLQRGDALRVPIAPRVDAVFAGSVPAVATPPGAAAAVPPEAGVLARTMWGEARGEGPDGMRAVGHVVLNRLARRNYWGATVEGVCRKPYQFSCWNDNDPNLRRLLDVDTGDASFRQALGIATDLLTDARGVPGPRDDPTSGATHYHTNTLFPLPAWARGHVACARIGHHLFYNDIA